MAAAAVVPSTIDLKTQATFPIRLGSSISKPANSSQYTGIRYNHKPRLSKSQIESVQIHQNADSGKSRLSIDVEDGEYSYSGSHEVKEECYVLVVRVQGQDKELSLERMGSNYGFNLERTPGEENAEKLARKYPQLQSDDSDEDLFGDEDEDMPPDDANPFDYRHFLKAELDKPERTNANLDAARSTDATPVVQPRSLTSNPVAKISKRTETKAQPLKKRKAPTVEKATPKRVKAGQEPESAETSKPKSKPELPKIALDRKASLRRPSLDDSGELILENETPVTEMPPRHGTAMAMALNGQLGNGTHRTGPISLQSAANSPHSHVASPGPSRPEEAEEEYVFEFDDEPESDGQEAPDKDLASTAGHEDADADVDDLELPSPAQAHRPSVTAQSATNAGDDEDDLDKQLALAMMEADQESEESEEE